MRELLTVFAVLVGLSVCVTAQDTLVFETEDWTTPKDAWEKDKSSPDKWNLWSTDKDAKRKWSGGVVLQSPVVKEDRARPEDGAAPLYTRITGIAPGRYEVELKMGRALAISRDGKTWQKIERGDLGTVDVTDGVFELWVDDRYAYSPNPGSAYYDCLHFVRCRPRVEKPKVTGFAPDRVREKLDRGPVALSLGGGRVHVGWRLLAGDAPDIAFNVHRTAPGGTPEKLNPDPIRDTTDFVDASAPLGAEVEYRIEAAGKYSSPVRVKVSAEPQDCITIKLDEGQTVQKVGIGDLDGDGRYDYVLKTPQDNIDPASFYWKPSPDTYKLNAYSHDGKLLWRHDLGWSIERGIWYSPMVVYDLDGDGKAEVAVKAGEGDPRGPDGRVETGPEYVSILDGATGRELARDDWPSREAPGEKYNYNYASRNQMCVAYLDGKTPCLIIERGTYTVIRLAAYQFHGGKLKKLWEWDNREEAGRGLWRGQGAHIMHAADVDGDGRDEVIIGSSVVDDNGNGLWTTGLGHPDFCFVGDIDPMRPGLEIFYGIEPRLKQNGLCLVDAKTGEIIWGLKDPTNHVGTDGMCADIDMRFPGSECHAADIDDDRKYAKSWVFSAAGELLSDKRQSGFARSVYWDADLQRELIRGQRIWDYNGASHATTVTGSVIAMADVLGDWREEIIASAPGELRIYTTTIPAMDRRVCLMQDPIYRLDVVVAFMGYYAAPMLSYDIASRSPGMSLTVPGGRVAPDAPVEGEVLMSGVAGQPLRGKLALRASGGAKIAPESADVQAPPGELAKVPFSISIAPAKGIPTERRDVQVAVRLELETRTMRAEAVLSVGDVPVQGYPMVECEDVAAEGGDSVKVREDKVGASGKSISHWDKEGHWLEWKIAAPKAGRYRIVVRYCAAKDAAREFRMGNATVRAVFASTGGLGGTTNDWGHAFVRDADGKILECDLDAGPHTIRMTNIDGNPMNMDYWLLAPVE